MNAFELRDNVIADYSSFIKGFIAIKDKRIQAKVEEDFNKGLLWPDPIVQLSPAFEPGESLESLINEGVLHAKCAEIFVDGNGKPLRLYKHQTEAIRRARADKNYVLTTGTGSGKSLTYIVPIVDRVLRLGSGGGVKAIVVYPMNALANSQLNELEKFLKPGEDAPVTFKRYTGQESLAEKEAIRDNPPDIILTNYVMLELMLTRWEERGIVEKMGNLQFLVFDELHSYRGRQGADVAMLARRTREASGSGSIINVGTSATLASSASREEQAKEVAWVATQIFGAKVDPENVVNESLVRATKELEFESESFKEGARRELAALSREGVDAERPGTLAEILGFADDYVALTESALASWIESTFGTRRESGPGSALVRQTPTSLSGEEGAGAKLAELLGVDREVCVSVLSKLFMLGYKTKNLSGRPFFAFRLHQFISGGDCVYATLEPEDSRDFYMRKQIFAPDGSRDRKLYPLMFCRCCGQEFYCVSRVEGENGTRFEPRDPSDQSVLHRFDKNDLGYLYASSERPFPFENEAEARQRLPDEWFDENGKLIKSRDSDVPRGYRISKLGEQVAPGVEGLDVAFLRTPFRYCPYCGASYAPSSANRALKDLGRLGGLATEGRSSATTILALSAVRHIHKLDLPKEAQKLLSFSDNRQDASLQAGHLNDFVEVSFLRAALYRALINSGDEGLTHKTLAPRVFDAMGLEYASYSANEKALKGQGRAKVNNAFQDVLGYKLFCDLKRGWRVLIPNLEQVGLLSIDYVDLDEVASDEETWSSKSSAVARASVELRREILRDFLDMLRRELAIDHDPLTPSGRKTLLDDARQNLKPRYGFDESATPENMRGSVYASPLPRKELPSWIDAISLSPQSGFGKYLRNVALPKEDIRIKAEEVPGAIQDMLDALAEYGIVNEKEFEVGASSKKGAGSTFKGYQIDRDCIVWKLGDEKLDHYDPIRQPGKSEKGERVNAFFQDFYKAFATSLGETEAREHTAQVPYEERERREEAFRQGELPILFCSPTMELGVDISQLNAVHMRNVPPTPANYAQRSGRAGRSGQPALIITYASARNQHDHYFFNRRREMVAGAVSPPQIDLTNEDLIRSHIRAVWLSEAVRANQLILKSDVDELLDMSDDPASGSPRCDVLPNVVAALTNPKLKESALKRVRRVLDEVDSEELFTDDRARETLDRLALDFKSALERWIGLFRSAYEQRAIKHAQTIDALLSSKDQKRADRERAQAEAEIRILTNDGGGDKSEYYTYRYLASEGFLPGYNFPRLPVVAFLPGTRGRGKEDKNDYLSRPRFLAIREFGPKAIVYHEGSKYVVDRIDSLASRTPGTRDFAGFSSAKICPKCGCYHEPDELGRIADVCEFCGAELGAAYDNLLQLKKVTATRRDRINCDEEERSRSGFEVQAAFRFATRGKSSSYRSARILTVDESGNETDWGELSYGASASIYRINNGYRRQSPENRVGFPLNPETGRWVSQGDLDPSSDPNDPERGASAIKTRPFVRDAKNCVLLTPCGELGKETAASLQAALRRGIRRVFSVEESEIDVFPLPDEENRRRFLFYEASEGGAGVLRHLLNPSKFREVVRESLAACHYDPETGEDLGRSEVAREECGAACYDCLLSFSNQTDHELLDRALVKDLLLALSRGRLVADKSPEESAAELFSKTDSELERKWLRFLLERGLRLPTGAQVFLPEFKTRPDFIYQDDYALVYVDGPPHDHESQKKIDAKQQEALEQAGYQVIRFRHNEDWDEVVARNAELFGADA